MAEEYLNINPSGGDQGKEPPDQPEPPQENRFLQFLKSVLTFLLLVVIVIASFWVSFQLGKKILMPVKKTPEQQIVVAIPEPPPSIQALQKLQEAMSKEATKKVATVSPRKLPSRHRDVCPVQRRLAGKHYYKVQAGWFLEEGNANGLATKLKESGFEVYIKKVGRGWRVQVGAYKTKPSAEVLRKRLKEKGFDSTIIYE